MYLLGWNIFQRDSCQPSRFPSRYRTNVWAPQMEDVWFQVLVQTSYMNMTRMSGYRTLTFLCCIVGCIYANLSGNAITSYKFGRVTFNHVLTAPDVTCDVLVDSQNILQCARSCQRSTFTGMWVRKGIVLYTLTKIGIFKVWKIISI